MPRLQWGFATILTEKAINMIIPPSRVSDQGNSEQWHHYIGTLNWGSGERDQAAFNAFLRAGSLDVDAEHAIDTVVQRIQSTGGTFNATKLQSQLMRAYQYAENERGKHVTIIQPPTPKFDPDKLKAFAAKAPGIDAQWLQTRSPVSPKGITSAAFLEHLYQPGEGILIFERFQSQGEHLFVVGADNSPLPTQAPDGVWFLSNPVDGQTHPNPRQDNKPSRRSEESVTSWRYLVLESDVAAPDQWLSCLVQLPLQISAIYSSGGKSIHALVRVDAGSKQQWDTMRDQIKSIMVPLGADLAAMTGVRLSRLPGVLRGDRLQELLYLNPIPTANPILL